MLTRGVVLVLSAGLAFGCASRPGGSAGPSLIAEQQELAECRQTVEARRAQHARSDAGRSARTGATVAGHIARGTFETWDPFLQIATLGLAATYGAGAALVDGGVRAVKRAGDASAALQACLVEAARLAPVGDAPPAAEPARDGAAELRGLGVEPPR